MPLNDPLSGRPEKPEGVKGTIIEKFENLKKNENMENLYSYATANKKDAIVYFLLVLSIILLLFQPLYGGAIIGILLGIYFSNEIYTIAQNAEAMLAEQGIVKVLVLGATVLALFLSAPAIFIGAAIAVVTKILILKQE